MRLIYILVFLISAEAFSQKVLDLTYHNIIGKEKTFQFFNNRDFSYRLKGHLICKTKIISNMSDSMLAFTDGTIIKINRIKHIRIKSANFSHYFWKAGILFMSLDVANNLLFDRTPIINERAAMISGIFVVSSCVVHYLQDKHIRIRKNSTFRVFDNDFENLNATK